MDSIKSFFSKVTFVKCWTETQSNSNNAFVVFSFILSWSVVNKKLCHLQAVTTCYNSHPDSVTGYIGHWKCSQFWHCCPCRNLNHMRRDLFLLLCHGLRTNSKHPLFRDFSHKGSRTLHCYLCISVLDWRHHRYILAACDAQFFRPCRCLRHLCYRVLHLLDICVSEGSRNKGHASWSHHRVLFCWFKADCCCEERVTEFVIYFCNFSC